jgi:putative Holliday junction resolvase
MSSGSWLGLDVGTRRIGVAVAREDIRIPSPLTTLENNDDIMAQLQKIVQEQSAQKLVVGLPRGMDGQDTEQTKLTEAFVRELQAQIAVPVVLQDEALTSQKAENELAARKKPYAKGDVDALAATYILEDYINEHVRGSYV